jgi:hypothetical protein
MNTLALLLLLSQTSTPPEAPRRQFSVHAFRSPSIGVELRDGFFALHVGAFPLIVDSTPEGGTRTTWFLKTGLTAYFLRYDLGSGRPSSLFASVSLVQGLNNDWNVGTSITRGTGVHAELGVVWAAWRGLDVRLGVGALVGFDGRFNVHPTPGFSWSTVF